MASSSLALDGLRPPYYKVVTVRIKASHTITQISTNSSGACQTTCFPLGKAVMAMTAETRCYLWRSNAAICPTKLIAVNAIPHCVGFPMIIVCPVKTKWCTTELTLNRRICIRCNTIYYAVWNSGLKSVITNAGASASTFFWVQLDFLRSSGRCHV